MSDPPERYSAPDRYKDITEYSVEEHVQRMQARKAGKPEPKVETALYREAKRKLLEDFGFEDDTPPDELTDPESMTVDDILATRKANR